MQKQMNECRNKFANTLVEGFGANIDGYEMICNGALNNYSM